MTMKHLGTLILLVVTVVLALPACGDSGSGGSGLPELPPTITPLPPSTPTDVPVPDPIQLPAIDWDDIDRFKAAMRPDFADDVEGFVNRNRYYIEANLRFEDGVAVLYGAQRVRYTNRSADTLNEITFRLYANLPALGGRMVIYQAEVNDVPVEPGITERESVMILSLDDPLEPGESVEMEMTFSVAAERGLNASYGAFGFQKDVFSGPEWYPTLSVYEEGSGWWLDRPTPQGDAAYTESGLYEVMLTVPENFVVAMSGSEIDAFASGNDTMTYHYVSGPMRDSLLVASPVFGVLTDYVDDIAVNVFYWPGDESAAEEILEMATDSVRIYNEKFGPYPFAELDVAETFNYTGIEYPGIIVLADRNWERGNQFMEITTAHEVAHQWWYSLVGNNQVTQPWIDESLTSYSEYVYMRDVHGEDRAKDLRDSDRDIYNFYRGTGAPDLVLDLPVTSYVDNNYGVIIYVKGPLFYYELEQVLGREIFFDAVNHYFERNRYEVAKSADVLDAFEEATGEELDALFYQWVGEFPGLDPAAIEEVQAQQMG
ncbi:MAG: M1 family metallopeptidase [Anaerolineae bacterium]|nr:M1 family metallopeptidase [Anaerolineae bacterium]